MGNARTQCPESAFIFHFKFYRSLCIFDQTRNLNEAKPTQIRDVPGMRWLRFIHFREQTVDSIVAQLTLKGHRLPGLATRVLKKVWLLMDTPDNKRRAGIIHNPVLWSEIELYVACMFFMKFDMACTDPIDKKSERGIRRLLLAQRSLSKTDQVLRREAMRDPYELMQMHVEWTLDRTRLPPAMVAQMGRTVFGVPVGDLGRLSCEHWTAGQRKLMRSDEVVVKESLRRGLEFKKKLVDMVLWGNLYPVTGEDVWPIVDEKGKVVTRFEAETEKKVLRDLEVHASKEGMRLTWDVVDAENEETEASVSELFMGKRA